jgi:hypothetical protein
VENPSAGQRPRCMACRCRKRYSPPPGRKKQSSCDTRGASPRKNASVRSRPTVCAAFWLKSVIAEPGAEDPAFRKNCVPLKLAMNLGCGGASDSRMVTAPVGEVTPPGGVTTPSLKDESSTAKNVLGLDAFIRIHRVPAGWPPLLPLNAVPLTAAGVLSRTSAAALGDFSHGQGREERTSARL